MYYKARVAEEQEELLFRAYLTDAVRICTENTGKMVPEGQDGQYLPRRYIDILCPQPEDTRDGSEIAADVIRDMGLTIEGGD